jgi:hypothetical protein
MNTSARAATAALAISLPVHLVIAIAWGAAALALLIYTGIALPAVWSAKPARRTAAAAVLRQLIDIRTSGNGQH